MFANLLANASFPPDTHVLILIGQMGSSFKVVALDCTSCLTKKILCTTIWGEVVIIATVLRNLKKCFEWNMVKARTF